MSFMCSLSAKEYYQAAILHNRTTEDFIHKAQKLYYAKPHEITTGCSSFGKMVKKRANAVLREIHHLSAYLRLRPFPEMLLVGKCQPEHKTGQLIAKSLAKRFSRFIITVVTPDGYFIDTERKDISNIPIFKRRNEEQLISLIRKYVERKITERIPEAFLLENGDYLWEKYYETQFLEQRLNTRLFHRFVPKYVMSKANMEIEKKFYENVVEKSEETGTLDNFFKKNAIMK